MGPYGSEKSKLTLLLQIASEILANFQTSPECLLQGFSQKCIPPFFLIFRIYMLTTFLRFPSACDLMVTVSKFSKMTSPTISICWVVMNTCMLKAGGSSHMRNPILFLLVHVSYVGPKCMECFRSQTDDASGATRTSLMHTSTALIVYMLLSSRYVLAISYWV